MSIRPRTVRVARAFAVAAFALLTAAATTAGALSASDRATVTLVVTDAQNGKAVPLASVALGGAEPLQGLTGATGRVVFDDVPAGTYFGSITKPGYRPTRFKSLRVEGGQHVTVSATLSKLEKVIATVVASSTKRVQFTSVSDTDAQTLASGSLGASLMQNPLVDGLSAANGAQSVSIEGHNPAQTGLYVDGVPIAPPGSITNLGSIGSDLFDSVDVKSAGALASGGAVDFQIPNPTLAFEVSGSGASSSFDSSRYAIFLRGTSGFLGYSFGHSTSGYDTNLSGDTYLDVSGLKYVHDQATLNQANVFKVRVPISATNVISASFLSSAYDADDYCNVMVGVLPCGYGPGNFSNQQLSSWQAKDALISGRTSAALTAFGSTLDGGEDQSNGYFAGLPNPLSAAYHAQSAGASVSASLYSTGSSQWSLSALTYGSRSSGTAQVALLSASAAPEAFGYGTVSLADSLYVTDRIETTVRAGFNGTTGARGALLIASDTTWQPSSNDKAAVSASAGTLFPQVTPVQGLSQTSALQFDCNAQVVYGTAPGSATPEPSEDADVRASLEHSFRGGVLTLTGYDQVLHGALLNGYIDGGAVAASLYPADYLNSIEAFYTSPFGCDRAASLDYADLALRQNVFGTALYQGVDVEGRVALGPRFLLQSYYTVTGARAASTAFGSTLSSATQIIGVPLQKGGILLDWRSGGDGTEIVGSLQHVSGNGPGYLPAYTTVGAGVRVRTERGDILFSASNLFDTFGQSFGSPQIGEVVGRVGAPALQLLGIPLQPRTFQVAYRLRVGRANESPATATDEDAGLPTSTSLFAAPLDRIAKADAFRINRQNPQCGPESLRFVDAIFSALEAYAAGPTVAVKQFPYGEVAYKRVAPDGTAAFLIGGDRPAIETALFACATVHVGTAAQAAALGAYVPTTADKNFDMVFMSRMGFYITYDKANVVQRNTTLATLPESVGPASVNPDPFRLLDGASCTADLRGAARYMLGQLNRYFTERSTTTLDGMTIVSHASPRPWYEITFDSANTIDALLGCAPVYGVSAQRAAALGIGSSPTGTLDFSPAVGLYEVR